MGQTSARYIKGIIIKSKLPAKKQAEGGSMGNWSREDALERYLRSYFLCCPICGNTQMTVNLVSLGRDTLLCDSCKAVWHVHIGLTGFKWA